MPRPAPHYPVDDTPPNRYPHPNNREPYEPVTPRSVDFDRPYVDWSALDDDDRFPND